jgi:putative restriction endonuclease
VRDWWVNQNQTYEAEISGGYVWSPKRNKNGARNQFYENMRELAPGDRIFSFRDRRIAAIGTVGSYCYEAPKPDEFGDAGKNWDLVGWRADVSWAECPNPIRPKDHIDQIRPLLPEKYSPLQQNGDGLQSVYLASVGKELADLLVDLLQAVGNLVRPAQVPTSDGQAEIVKAEVENHVETQIANSVLSATEKDQLVKARRGQGKFRENVQKHEKSCRITGIRDTRFLIASHIKPWRSASNVERLDGENGLMLSPNVDFLFDRGFISFADDGRLLISPVADIATLTRLGIQPNGQNVGEFTQGQRRYLGFHRREVFLEAGSE